jgi:imidazolonepropionase-like amidohydrolase
VSSCTKLALALSAVLLTGSIVDAQRPSRGQMPRRQAPPQQKPEPKPEKKEEAKDLPRVAYVGATIHVGNGQVIRSGTVLTQGSKIEAVGVGVELPEGTRKVDVSGKHMAPGFVALNASGLGLRGGGRGGELSDNIDPFEDSMLRALAVGITSYLYQSGSGSSMPSGNSAVIKIKPGDLEDVILRDDVVASMRAPLSASDKRKLEEAVEKAKKYIAERTDFERKQEAGDKNAKAPELDKKLKPLLDVMRGDTRLRVSCDGSAKGLRGVIEICKMLDVPAMISGSTEAWVVADELAETGSMVLVYPREDRPEDKTLGRPNGSTVRNAKILSDAGITVAVAVQPSRFGGANIGDGGILGQDLNTPFVDAAFAVRGGLTDEEGLMTLTAGPAKMLGVDDRIGSIEAGKDADLLILSGDPLHYATFVDLAIVDGKLRYDRQKYPFYRKLGRR